MFSKKGKRKIVVDDMEYYRSATGNDNWINLWVATEVPSSPRLQCYFRYHQDQIASEHNGQQVTRLSNQFVVTPYVVRQAILYALANGWDPSTRGKDLSLGHLDNKIDIHLEQNKENSLNAKN